MRILFKIIVGCLAAIGAVTITLAAYLYFMDPFDLKGMFQPAPSSLTPTSNGPVGNSGQYYLSPAQKLFLDKVGIDPSALPSTISPELEQCLTNAVGEERVKQIKEGAPPSPMDFIKARTCLAQ